MPPPLSGRTVGVVVLRVVCHDDAVVLLVTGVGVVLTVVRVVRADAVVGLTVGLDVVVRPVRNTIRVLCINEISCSTLTECKPKFLVI